MGNVGDRERFLQDQLRAAWKLKQRPTTDDRSIAIALFHSYLFTVHFQPTSFSAPCIYTSNWFTCVCVFPCTCRRLTDGDQVSPEKGNSSFSSLFHTRFSLFSLYRFESHDSMRPFLHRFFTIVSSFTHDFFFLSLFFLLMRVGFERSFHKKKKKEKKKHADETQAKAEKGQCFGDLTDFVWLFQSPLPRGYPPPSSTMLFDDDPGIMSEVETSSTGFRRGGKQRSSLPVVRTPSKTLERPLGNDRPAIELGASCCCLAARCPCRTFLTKRCVSVDDSLGLVFLQYRNETKRALLPNEITSIDTVKALFVRSFPKQLTMEYLDSPHVKVYIHDSNKDMFYELEDLRYLTVHTAQSDYRRID